MGLFSRIFGKLKKTMSFEGVVLVSFAEKPGVFDIEKFAEYREKAKASHAILLHTEKCTDAVIRTAKQLGIELRQCTSTDSQKCIEEVLKELESARKAAKYQRLEDIADRSLMRDAF